MQLRWERFDVSQTAPAWDPNDPHGNMQLSGRLCRFTKAPPFPKLAALIKTKRAAIEKTALYRR